MTVLDPPKIAVPRRKLWSVREYQSLVEHGAFRNQHVVLHRGELVEMPPMGALHARSLSRLTVWLAQNFEPEMQIRIQSPFESADSSLPEPDGAVYSLAHAGRLPHPNRALLLIEISDSSFDLDHQKAFDYAAAGVQEYWIIDVVGKTIEVFRMPIVDASAPLGFRYQSRDVVPESGTLAALARPDLSVAVNTLLASA